MAIISDDMSGVREIDFALGKTVHDTDLHSWDRHGNLTMLLVVVNVADGVPAWVRIRAIDNGEYYMIPRVKHALS